MSSKRLKMRCPSAEFVTTAYLPGYKLQFNKLSTKGGVRNGKGNIIPTNSEEDRVWGVVFEISENEKSALDSAEGLGFGYDQFDLIVITDQGTKIEVIAYIGTRNDDSLLPFDWYKEHCVRGGAEFGLPNEYLDFLRSFDVQPSVSIDRATELSIYE